MTLKLVFHHPPPENFSAAKAAQEMQMSVHLSVRLSVRLSVCSVSFPWDNFCKYYPILLILGRHIVYRNTFDEIAFGGGASMTLTSGDLESLKIHFESRFSFHAATSVNIIQFYSNLVDILYTGRAWMGLLLVVVRP